MPQTEDQTLPYRAEAADIATLVEGRAHGREVNKIKTQFSSRSAFQGALSTASTLGFLVQDEGELTERGRQFALADREERRELLLEALLEYEPYELLLGAIFKREEEEVTKIDWIERWWATHEYGTSETNRSEGSTTFAKMIEYIGLGEYKQGRRGYETRIEWDSNADSTFRDAQDRILREEDTSSQEKHQDISPTQKSLPEGEEHGESVGENNALTLNFSNDRVAKLSLPPTLSQSEKKRLVSLVELMVATEGDGEATQMGMKL